MLRATRKMLVQIVNLDRDLREPDIPPRSIDWRLGILLFQRVEIRLLMLTAHPRSGATEQTVIAFVRSRRADFMVP